MTDELRDRINRAAQALREAGAREVYLFGSAARDTMREDSDVDIAISGLPPQIFFRAMGWAEEAIGRPVMLVDLDEEGPFTIHLRQHGRLRRVA